MKKLDFLAGEKVIKNSGETFRVVSVNSWNNIITLDDGKIGYDLKNQSIAIV